MKKAVHIVFVTTANLATNPRLVKEVELALSLSYSVSIIAFRFENWSKSLNEQIINRFHHRVNYIEISAGRRPLMPWLFSSILQQLCLLLAQAGLHHPMILSQALQKRTILLLYALKRISPSANLIVAHNPGSFYPVMHCAKRHKIPYGIDVEDYHPGETNDKLKARWMQQLMKSTLAHAAYITAASPLIAGALKELTKNDKIHTVLNVFSSQFAVQHLTEIPSKPLKLFWFSQYIGKGRGLEQVLAAMGKLRTDDIQLSLLGNCTVEMWQYFQDKARLVGLSEEQLQFLQPVPEKEIITVAAQHHIGLAVEPGKDFNNTIALSNKIFMYLLAGNAIIFTNTAAQEAFFAQHKEIGSMFSVGNIETLANILQNYLDHPDILDQQRAASLALAKTLNWEQEQKQFLDIVAKTLAGTHA